MIMQQEDKELQGTPRGGIDPTPCHPPPHRLAKPPTQQVNNRQEGARVQDTGYSPGGWGAGQLKVQLMIQKISDVMGRVCTVLWDTGAQISLVTHHAREAGFKGCPASIQISGVGTGNKNRSKVQYKVLLKKRDRGVAEFTPWEWKRSLGMLKE